jgi:hypothetical protein
MNHFARFADWSRKLGGMQKFKKSVEKIKIDPNAT